MPRPTAFRYVDLTRDIDTGLELGGEVIVIPCQAALNIGDAVLLASDGRAAKSSAVGNYVTRLGIVVGGDATGGLIKPEKLNDVGTAATTAAGQNVIVLIRGVCYAVAGEAMATIGTKFSGGIGVSGRIGLTGAATGNIMGYTLEAAAGAASVIKVLIGFTS